MIGSEFAEDRVNGDIRVPRHRERRCARGRREQGCARDQVKGEEEGSQREKGLEDCV